MNTDSVLNSLSSINDASRRPLRYWNIDGLPEIAMGLLWLVWGLVMLGSEMASSTAWKGALVLLGMLVLVVGGFLSQKLIEWAKQRITYPRTGYVKMRDVRQPMAMAMSFLAAFLFAAIVVLVKTGTTRNVFAAAPVFLGVLLSAAFGFAAWRHACPRYLVLSFTALCAGLGFTVAGLDLNWAILLFFLLLGVVSTIAGALALRRYLHEHPAPETQA